MMPSNVSELLRMPSSHVPLTQFRNIKFNKHTVLKMPEFFAQLQQAARRFKIFVTLIKTATKLNIALVLGCSTLCSISAMSDVPSCNVGRLKSDYSLKLSNNS
jgi:hypothetical protein